MKTTFLLSTALSALFPIVAAQSQLPAKHASVCPSLNNKQAALDNGDLVQIYCDTYPLPYNPTPLGGINTIAQCADTCNENTACEGSVWSQVQRKCWVTDQQDSNTVSAPGLVFIKQLRNSTSHSGGHEYKCPQGFDLVDGACFPRSDPCPGCDEELQQIQECRRIQKKTEDDILSLRGELESAKTRKCTALGFGTVDPANDILDTRNICPQHHLREFFLPTPDGGTSKWRVYCDHAAYEIRWNAAGFMNETGTPYNQLLAHRHWDAGYRAFYWRDTDFFHRHLAIYTVEPNLRQSQLDAFHIKSLPAGRHHVIVRIDDVPLKIV
ncbi:hypothetical protein N7471_007816 [Penicillium samsonianum]|uniref:uncharacterized protein n=1 Tax=Penicillium samsonianum TaxID=1882272 RepID=UPI002546CD6F|nr:uncharacterized protein N7471_007816 [Penicillium samsonianum]KAJ6132601.1 hypothetical protein N7471_007816 [Penicillium samsonianum]